MFASTKQSCLFPWRCRSHVHELLRRLFQTIELCPILVREYGWSAQTFFQSVLQRCWCWGDIPSYPLAIIPNRQAMKNGDDPQSLFLQISFLASSSWLDLIDKLRSLTYPERNGRSDMRWRNYSRWLNQSQRPNACFSYNSTSGRVIPDLNMRQCVPIDVSHQSHIRIG